MEPEDHCRIHKFQSLVLILSQLDPIHTSFPTSWRFILIFSPYLGLVLPSGLFPSGFPTKTLYMPLLVPKHVGATYLKLMYIWIKIDQLDVTCLLFHYLMLNMFRILIHPSSGACDLFVQLFHGLYCSGTMCVSVMLWFAQPNHNITPTHIGRGTFQWNFDV